MIKKNITKYAKFVINIKKVLRHPIIQRNTKISFLKKLFKTYSGGCFFFGKVEEILVVSKIWVAQVFVV